LIVNINDSVYVREAIHRENSLNGWKDYKINLSHLIGSEVYAEIVQAYNGNEKSTAYWHDMKVIEE